MKNFDKLLRLARLVYKGAKLKENFASGFEGEFVYAYPDTEDSKIIVRDSQIIFDCNDWTIEFYDDDLDTIIIKCPWLFNYKKAKKVFLYTLEQNINDAINKD